MARIKSIPNLAIPPAAIAKDTLDFEGYLEVFPNPSSGDISFYFEIFDDAVISIHDIRGRTVGSLSITGHGKKIITLKDMNLILSSGIYFCELRGKYQKEVRKFVVL